MKDIHHKDLSYGLLGNHKYRNRIETWEFSRDLSSGGLVFKQVTPWDQVLVPTDEQFATTGQDDNALSARTARSQVQLLLKSYPELGTWVDEVDIAHRVSLKLADTSDPGVGELIAVLKLSDRRYRRPVGVIASVNSAARTVIRFDMLDRHPFEIDQAGSGFETTYKSFSIGQHKPGWFDGARGPIQQIVASHSESEWGSNLAIRTCNGITILRPFLSYDSRRRNARPGEHPSTPPNPSRVDPGYTLDLEFRDWGLQTVVDVQFNSWDNSQIAAVDAEGHWVAWKISKAETETMALASLAILSEGHIQQTKINFIPSDGWTKIRWMCRGEVIVVVRRRHAILRLVEANATMHKSSVDLNIFKEAREWILDIQNCPHDPDAIVALTTHRLSLIRLQVTLTSSGVYQLRWKIAFATEYQPSIRSLSLKLVLTAHAEDVLVAIYGSNTPDITTFSFKRMEVDIPWYQISDKDTIVFDQVGIEGKEASADGKSGNRIFAYDLFLLPVIHSVDLPRGVFDSCRFGDRRHFHFRAFIFTHDMVLRSCILKVAESEQQCIPADIVPPNSQPSSRASSVISEDDVIISDADDSTDAPNSQLPIVWRAQSKTRRHSTSRSLDPCWDYLHVPYAVTKGQAENQAARHLTQSIIDDESKKLIVQRMTGQNGIFTLFEIRSLPYSVPAMSNSVSRKTSSSQIDRGQNLNAAKMVSEAEVTSEAKKISGVQTTSKAPGDTMTLSALNGLLGDQIGQPSFDEMHGSLVKTVITPLNSEINGRARVALNRSLRALSVQDYLSASFLRSGSTAVEQEHDKKSLDVSGASAAVEVVNVKLMSRDQDINASSSKGPGAQLRKHGISAAATNTQPQKKLSLLSELGVYVGEDHLGTLERIKTSWAGDYSNGKEKARQSQSIDRKTTKQPIQATTSDPNLDGANPKWHNSPETAIDDLSFGGDDAAVRGIGDLSLGSSQPVLGHTLLSSQLGGLTLGSFTSSQPTQSQGGQRTTRKRKAGFR